MKKPIHPGRCPLHNARMVQRRSIYGVFYACPQKGEHGKPCEWLGNFSAWDGRFYVSNKATRAARIRAHRAFDKLWKGDEKRMDRRAAYRWLRGMMGLTPTECHIGHMDQWMCEGVIGAVQRLYRDNKKEHEHGTEREGARQHADV